MLNSPLLNSPQNQSIQNQSTQISSPTPDSQWNGRTHARFENTGGRLAHLLLAALACLLTMSTGCYPDWPQSSGRAEVQGIVTLDGLPLNDAKLVFLPQELKTKAGMIKPLAFGVSNSDGAFSVKYADGTKDLLSGNYTVIISKANAAGSWPTTVRGWSNLRIQGETIPAIYNRQSTLDYKVEASPHVLRTKFELFSNHAVLE